MGDNTASTLVLAPEARAAIAAHAEATYPDECVGLLLGQFETAGKVAVAAFPVENRWEGQVRLGATDDPTSRRDRFYLDPRDYMRADRAARAEGLDLVGCYHSHPDWPAEPSERDRVGAQALGGSNFSFVIQSVRDGRAADITSWLLTQDGSRFENEALQNRGDVS
jgi:proteasome lid subunit RPN8/RPN11